MATFSIDTDLLCKQYLSLLYRDARGHGVNVRQRQVSSEAYGEILYQGVTALLARVPLSDQDVFFDLGSGLGKVVVQIFLQSAVNAAYGIEILPELYAQSSQVAKIMQQALPDFFDNRKLDFLLGSFLALPLDQATVVLVSSPCFTPSLLCALEKKIEETASIHTILTLRPMNTLKRFKFVKAIRIECSWDAALCYVYCAKSPK